MGHENILTSYYGLSPALPVISVAWLGRCLVCCGSRVPSAWAEAFLASGSRGRSRWRALQRSFVRAQPKQGDGAIRLSAEPSVPRHPKALHGRGQGSEHLRCRGMGPWLAIKTAAAGTPKRSAVLAPIQGPAGKQDSPWGAGRPRPYPGVAIARCFSQVCRASRGVLRYHACLPATERAAASHRAKKVGLSEFVLFPFRQPLVWRVVPCPSFSSIVTANP